MSTNIPQTSYSQYFTEFVVGVPAFAAEVERKISRIAANIIPYGRIVVQSRLFDSVCRLPRLNKVVILDNAGTFTAGSIQTVIAHGNVANLQSSEDGVVSTTTTVTTTFGTDKATTMAAHAANIKAALADCYSCAYDGSAHTITFTGDCEDIITSATTMTASGYGDTGAITSDTISSADVATDILGISFLTHNRQQLVTTGLEPQTHHDKGCPVVSILRPGIARTRPASITDH